MEPPCTWPTRASSRVATERTSPTCRSPRSDHRLPSLWPWVVRRTVPAERRPILSRSTRSPCPRRIRVRAAATAPCTPPPHPPWSPRWLPPHPRPRRRSVAGRDRDQPRPPRRHHLHRRTATAMGHTTTATIWWAPRPPRSNIATLLPPWQQQQRQLSFLCK